MSIRIGDVDTLARAVARRRNAAAFDETTLGAVRVIIASVRRSGDAAVLRTVRRFDRRLATLTDLWVDAAGLRRAARRCPPDLRSALDASYAAILGFHRTQRPTAVRHRGAAFSEAFVPQPLARVGGCVPRGTVGYPSTALMIGVPARVAGVEDLVLASPMPADGEIDPVLAYAATKIGARGLYRAGGAAAVAALDDPEASGEALRHVLVGGVRSVEGFAAEIAEAEGGDPLPAHQATKIIGAVLAELD